MDLRIWRSISERSCATFLARNSLLRSEDAGAVGVVEELWEAFNWDWRVRTCWMSSSCDKLESCSAVRGGIIDDSVDLRALLTGLEGFAGASESESESGSLRFGALILAMVEVRAIIR